MGDNGIFYNVMNITEFEKLDVPALPVTAFLERLGNQTINVAQSIGGLVVVFMGYVLLLPPESKKYIFYNNEVAAYIDENNDLWVGINENSL